MFGWYENERSGLGLEFLDEFRAAYGRIVDGPLKYRDLRSGIRRALLRRFPYAVYFAVEESTIVVLAVLHAHRDPAALAEEGRLTRRCSCPASPAADRQGVRPTMARKRARQGERGSRPPGRASRWDNIDFLIQGHGDVTLGRVGPIGCAATAADDDRMLAALVRRDDESFEDLLDRLEAAIQRTWDTDEVIDEING